MPKKSCDSASGRQCPFTSSLRPLRTSRSSLNLAHMMSLGCHTANLTLESAPAFLTSRHEIVKLPACRCDWKIEDTMQYHTCVAMGTCLWDDRKRITRTAWAARSRASRGQAQLSVYRGISSRPNYQQAMLCLLCLYQITTFPAHLVKLKTERRTRVDKHWYVRLE